MNIEIKRDEKFEKFELELSNITLLEALKFIKEHIDSSLIFKHSCRSGVCGSCAMRVNEKEVLACEYKVQDGDKVEPLKNLRVIRDLIVDYSNSTNSLKNSAYLQQYNEFTVTHEDEGLYKVQTTCILCHSCYSSCPVYEFNPNFIAPFTLSRINRYILDNREENKKDKIDVIQNDGIWSCTLCGNCSLACPKGIDIKGDISMLRNKSGVYGYSDPNFAQFNSFDGGGINFGSFN